MKPAYHDEFSKWYKKNKNASAEEQVAYEGKLRKKYGMPMTNKYGDSWDTVYAGGSPDFYKNQRGGGFNTPFGQIGYQGGSKGGNYGRGGAGPNTYIGKVYKGGTKGFYDKGGPRSSQENFAVGGGGNSDWGSRLDADPGMAFTADFKDSDGDGVDDRMQRGPGQPKGKVGQDFNKGKPSNNISPSTGRSQGFNRNVAPAGTGEGSGESGGSTGEPGIGNGTGSNPNQMANGLVGFSDIMKQFFNWSPEAHDDEGRGMKNALMGDWISKYFDSNLSKAMGQYQAGLSKDMMTHQWSLEQMGQSNSRKEEFGYGMRAMDKQYELQNLFANQQYGRDIGMLSATGEQTRKNYQAQGVENRLQAITEGEQNRLYRAADGDQTRKTARVLGDEERQTVDRKGLNDRLYRMEDGYQNRETLKTSGRQERLNIDRRGKNQRQAIRVTGDEERQNIGARGVQERLNIGARGEQERLNIGARGDQERQTIDFSDNIDARKESRQRGRARALARSF